MAAYVATHDRSVLANKPYEDTKVSVTQTTTHKDILGKLIFLISQNQSRYGHHTCLIAVRLLLSSLCHAITD